MDQKNAPNLAYNCPVLVLRYMGCDQEYEFKLAVAQGDSEDDDEDDDEEEDKEGDMSDSKRQHKRPAKRAHSECGEQSEEKKTATLEKVPLRLGEAATALRHILASRKLAHRGNRKGEERQTRGICRRGMHGISITPEREREK